MKKQSYLAIALAVLAASAAGAQARDTTRSAERTGAEGQRGDRPRDGRRNDGRTRRDPLLRGIQLSDGQRQRIEAIDARHRREREAARDAGTSRGDREAGRERMREAMDRRATEVRAVLTPAQQQQFDRNREEMRARMQQGGPGKPGRGSDGPRDGQRGGGQRGA